MNYCTLFQRIYDTCVPCAAVRSLSSLLYVMLCNVRRFDCFQYFDRNGKKEEERGRKRKSSRHNAITMNSFQHKSGQHQTPPSS